MKVLKLICIHVVVLIVYFRELNATDCRRTIDDLSYHGNINVTRKGTQCAYWNTVKYLTEEKNYCRTPAGDGDNGGGPWCYVYYNNHVYWERCNVPVCYSEVCPGLAVHNLETLDRKTSYQYGESVIVSCKSGYKRIGNKYLTCLKSGHWNESIPRCEDVNECSTNPCENGGKCIDGVNRYTCTCLGNYFGINCQYAQTFKIAPKIRLDEKITVNEGSNVSHVPCFAEGIPAPIIKWESIDKSSMPFNARQIGHFIIFDNVTVVDSGIYMCTARNEMGSDIKVVHIIVKAKSHVLHTAPVIYALTSVKVDYYTSTMLFCNVTGFPLPSITWIYKNKVIQSSGNSLAVQNVTNSTVGYYTCTASNDVGTNQVRILLEASYDTPHIVTPPTTAVIVLGFSHNFTCIATGHPKPSIAWSFKSFAQESMTMPSHHIYNQGHMLNLFALKTLESGTLTCTALNEFGRDKATATVIFRNPSTTSFG